MNTTQAPQTACAQCRHSPALHDERGCHTPGCACRAYVSGSLQIDLPPPKPGACVHTGQRTWWVVESPEEIRDMEEAATSGKWLELHGVDVTDGEYVNFPVFLKLMFLLGVHGVTDKEWARVLGHWGVPTDGDV